MPNVAAEHLRSGDHILINGSQRRVTQSEPRCGADHGEDGDFWFLGLDYYLLTQDLPAGVFSTYGQSDAEAMYFEVRRGTLLSVTVMSPGRDHA